MLRDCGISWNSSPIFFANFAKEHLEHREYVQRMMNAHANQGLALYRLLIQSLKP